MNRISALEGLRADCADLFDLQLLSWSKWAQTPCVVHCVEGWRIARSADQLLGLPDETEVLCPWPGQWRQDVFLFTVGEFWAAWETQKTP